MKKKKLINISSDEELNKVRELLNKGWEIENMSAYACGASFSF